MKEMTKKLHLKTEATDSVFDIVKIKESNDANLFARQFYFDDIEIYESMFIIFLNRANDTIAYVKISQGGISGTAVDVRLIAKYAIDVLASSVVIVHNHPSGSLVPSSSDMNITDKAKKTLRLFDVRVLDHLILTKNEYYSFADNGVL